MGASRRKPELLLPASCLEVLQTAVRFGADAVYIGGASFSLRAKAKNFSMEEMARGIAFAHEYGKKVYVTANIIAHDRDLAGVREYFEELRELEPDGLIISDPGVFQMAKELCPDIPRHVSTQANNCNRETFRFWQELGAKRVVCARELSLKEICAIKDALSPQMELEAFVHGAMCISYSGRCLLSNFLTGRDANQGSCTHPCRWKYALMEETRPGEFFPVMENERGTFLLNSKDLCMIDHIPDLVEAGIDSFKVEGRMKSALYVATVGRAYRLAIDDFFADPEKYERRKLWYRQEIGKCTNRTFTTGFYYGKPGAESMIYDNSTYVKEYTYLGTLGERQGSYFPLEQKNKFSVGELLEAMGPDGSNEAVTVKEILDETGTRMESCPHARQKILVRLSGKAEPFWLLRREEKEEKSGQA